MVRKKKIKPFGFRPCNQTLAILEAYMKEKGIKSRSEAINSLILELHKKETITFPTELNPEDFKGVHPETVKALTKYMQTRLEYLKHFRERPRKDYASLTELEVLQWEYLFGD